MDVLEFFHYFIYKENLFVVSFVLLFLFSALYFGITGTFQLYVVYALRIKIASKIVDFEKFPNQIKYEIKNSLFSILIFALYGLLIVVLIRVQVLHVHFNMSYFVLFDLLLLIFWNEIHFYLCHRIMHTKSLFKYHGVHHRSVVVTPFSTYSFHPLESLINGTVMIIPMFFYSFEVFALFLFPIYHLIFNSIGHTNIIINWKNVLNKGITISSRHNLHHTKTKVSYGFMSSFMDYLFTRNKV